MAHADPSARTTWIPCDVVMGLRTPTGVDEPPNDVGRKAIAWACTKCHFVVGGPNLATPPKRCPMCTVAAGQAFALMPSVSGRLSMLVLDRRFLQLVESYRAAKAEQRDSLSSLSRDSDGGHYELDGSPPDSESGLTAAAESEQRTALALADAALDRSGDRVSRSSLH